MARASGRIVLAFGALLAFAALSLCAPAANAAPTSAVSRHDAIKQLDVVRASIDRTLRLMKEGHAEQAITEAKNGYLNHFEYVEIPLRVVAAQLTADAETKFAEIRGLINQRASVSEIRSNIIGLRRIIDDAERRLTDVGVGAPTVVFSQSFLIIFREGLEAVLLISVLLGYLEAAKATQYRRPIIMGMAAAAVATVVTFALLRTLLARLPVGREMLEAVTALLAVAVLFYVSFWLIARLEQKRWLEFLRARVWTAVSVGSTTALMLVGFTAVFREGFETALFYQALVTFGPGLGKWVAAGLGVGLVALGGVAWVIFRLGRKVPIKVFLSSAVVLLMFTSVAFLGNAVRALQEADVIGLHRWPGWPRPPIFLAQALGYWPTRETLLSQTALSAVYVAGALYMFVVRPRRRGSLPVAPSSPPSSPGSRSTSGAAVPVDAG
jgi:high-affinity iron transporter